MWQSFLTCHEMIGRDLYSEVHNGERQHEIENSSSPPVDGVNSTELGYQQGHNCFPLPDLRPYLMTMMKWAEREIIEYA